MTDGTTAGTIEIGGLRNAGIKGAAAAPHSFSPSIFTLFGNKMLFKAYDFSGHYGLWITNGTAAGTTEISYLVKGGYYFTVLGSKVFFANSGGWPLGHRRDGRRHRLNPRRQGCGPVRI